MNENNNQQVWCEEEQKYFPRYTTENGITYELDEKIWTYNPIMQYTTDPKEQELMKEPIGRYGQKWQEFMQENYPENIPSLTGRCRWEIIPRQIDLEAAEMYSIMSEKYAKDNPRPHEFLEIAAWEKMKNLEIQHTIMTEIVLKPRA